MRRQRKRETVGETRTVRVDRATGGPTDTAILGAHGARVALACRAHPTHTSKRHSFALEPCRGRISMCNEVQRPPDSFTSPLLWSIMPHPTSKISSATPTSLVRVGFSMQSRFVRQQTKLRCSCQTRERRRRRRRRPAWHRQPRSGGPRARSGGRACGYVWAPKPGNGGAVFVAT